MKILMVLSDQTLPHDRRVERQARDLIRDGHQVYLLARKGKDQPPEEIFNGIHVTRMRWPFLNRSKMLSDLAYWLFQRYWIYCTILKTCRKYGIGAIHVHDLPYARAAAGAAKKLGLPLIFDMHENYPVLYEMGFQSRQSRWTWPLFYLILTLLKRDEKIACRRADKIIIVAREHAGRICDLGVSPEKIAEVTNTEDIDFFSGLAIDESIFRQYKDDFVILYVGGFSVHRGLETAIDAMPKILKAIPNAKLLLVGGGYMQPALEERIQKLNLQNQVQFPGYQPFARLPTYITLAQAGIIPHISTPHVEMTMPNKIFQFMMLGRPVIVSNTGPMMRVVRDADCGLIFEERNADSLAETCIQLKNGDLRHRLGANGQIAVREKYNWQITVGPLLKIYRDLEGSSECFAVSSDKTH